MENMKTTVKHEDFDATFEIEQAKRFGVALIEMLLSQGNYLSGEAIEQSDFYRMEFVSEFADLLEEYVNIEYEFKDEV